MAYRRGLALHFHLVAYAAMLCLAATLSAQTPVWKTFSYPADGFSISFPSAPEFQKKPIPTDVGTVELHSYIAEGDSAMLFAAACDYGAQAAGKDPDVVLQAAKKAVLQSPNTQLVSEKKIMLGVNHGLAYEAVSDQALYSVRIYVVGSTLYQTLVLARLGKPYADAAQFLDSFELIARPGN
jgi:hypothetical protein